MRFVKMILVACAVGTGAGCADGAVVAGKGCLGVCAHLGYVEGGRAEAYLGVLVERVSDRR